jgi:predicted porin
MLMGFNTGVGINYHFKNIALIAEYQYLYTFTKIVDQAALIPVPQENITRDVVKMNNHVISLGVKYYFKKEE